MRCGLSGCFFFQAEDGIRDLVRSRGLGDVYKRQVETDALGFLMDAECRGDQHGDGHGGGKHDYQHGLSLIHI